MEALLDPSDTSISSSMPLPCHQLTEWPRLSLTPQFHKKILFTICTLVYQWEHKLSAPWTLACGIVDLSSPLCTSWKTLSMQHRKKDILNTNSKRVKSVEANQNYANQNQTVSHFEFSQIPFSGGNIILFQFLQIKIVLYWEYERVTPGLDGNIP